MPGLPVYCPNCGTIFESRAFGFAPGASLKNISLVGNTESCIMCGKMAHIVDGTFDLPKGGVLELVSGPPISKAIWEKFESLVAKAANGEISKDDLQEAVNKIDPALGKFVSLVNAKQLGIAALVILFLFVKSCNFKLDATVDVNKLYDQWMGRGTKVEASPSMGPANPKPTDNNKGASGSETSSDRPDKK